MYRHITRSLVACALALFTLVALAGRASAHVSPVDPTAPAGGYATVELQIPHGCDGQATNQVSVQLRDDMSSVKAQAIPGWTVEYERQPLDEPIEVHGQPVEDFVAVVTWTTAADPLPDDQFMRFGISMKMPDLPGETVLLPTVQHCVAGGESAWLDADPDADHPAPSIELVAAGDAHGSSDRSDGGGAEPVSSKGGGSEEASAKTASADTATGAGSDRLARTIGLIGIVVAAGAALVAARRRA